MTSDAIRQRLAVFVPSLAAMLIPACADRGNERTEPPELTPEALISWWNEARNIGDPTQALALVDERANIFGYQLGDPDDHAELVEVLTAQAEAGWRIIDHPCTTADDIVTCDYVMSGSILRSWDLEFTGTHTYTVSDTRILVAERTHDPDSARRVHKALEEFRTWASAHHPDLVTVIWSTPNAPAYTTVDGARAMLSLLDDYARSPESVP